MDKDMWTELRDSWPSVIITRAQVGRWSGGLLQSGTLRNLDSLGQGPPRQKVGRKIVYRITDLITWMRDRCE